MLSNHHGQVISGLKNMDLFLSIDLAKVEDIAHVPPPFQECDNWAAPHKQNQNQHVYYSSLRFGRNNHVAGNLPTPNMSWVIEAFSLCVAFTNSTSGPPWNKRAPALGLSRDQCV